MEDIATYYVTLKPIREGGIIPAGMRNIALVDNPAVEEMGIYLSAHDSKVVATDEEKKAILKYLENCGIEQPINWVEISENEYLEARKINLSNDPTDSESYNDFSKKGGGGQWLVRYKYQGPRDEKTRDFCSRILSLGRLYTEEEISNGLSNSEFGQYSIFDYKGSYGCRHVWKRMIFFEDYEDKEVRRVGIVPQVVARLDDRLATTLNAYLSKDEKMQIVAPLLIPEIKIPRNDKLGRWNMVWSKDSIRELYEIALSSGAFDKQDLFKDTHQGGQAPTYVLDKWISESPNDKAYLDYGFNVNRTPIGTLFVHSQVTDKNYWDNEIKKNKKHAYSIEALMNLSIIKMSKMEKEQIILPDGEHLINGTIYVVKDGIVIEKKEVTLQQEEIIEEVVKAAPELMEEMPSALPKKEDEMTMKMENDSLGLPKKEEDPKLIMEEMPEVIATDEIKKEELPVSDDRVAKLEAAQEEILSEIAKIRSEIETPTGEDITVEMSDNRPLWKKISDGLNVIKKQL